MKPLLPFYRTERKQPERLLMRSIVENYMVVKMDGTFQPAKFLPE